MTHSYVLHKWVTYQKQHYTRESLMRKWLIYTCDIKHGTPWLIHMCYISRGTHRNQSCQMHIWVNHHEMTHSYVWHQSQHTMTHSHVFYESVLHQKMTHSHVWHNSWHTMTHSYVLHKWVTHQKQHYITESLMRKWLIYTCDIIHGTPWLILICGISRGTHIRPKP